LTKANAFAQCWEAKNKLPQESHEHAFFPVPPALPEWFPIRPRAVKRLLSKLRLDQATGPDGIGARFLKELAEELALPIALLCRRIFFEASWPQQWRLHLLIPIFKKGSVYQPGQYRGIHLTCILSKTVERAIGQQLIPFL